MLENQHDIGRLHERPMAVVTAAVLLLIVFATSSDDVLSDDDCSLFFFDDAGRGNIFFFGLVCLNFSKFSRTKKKKIQRCTKKIKHKHRQLICFVYMRQKNRLSLLNNCGRNEKKNYRSGKKIKRKQRKEQIFN